MATCGISANLTSSDCRNALVGGIDKLWILNRDDLASYTVLPGSGTVSALSLRPGAFLYSFQPIRGTASMTSEKAEGQVTRYSLTVEARFAEAGGADLAKLRTLSGNARYALIALYNDGLYRCVGFGDEYSDSRGLFNQANNHQSGAAFEEAQGHLLSFVGADTVGVLALDTGATADDLAALELVDPTS